jgi:hypothetical protein
MEDLRNGMGVIRVAIYGAIRVIRGQNGFKQGSP